MHFRILGPVEIGVRDLTVTLPRRRERCLLAVLLLELNRVVPGDRLIELLWDGVPPVGARQNLRSHVSRVRSSLAPGCGESDVKLVHANGGYRIEADREAVDVHRFRMSVEHAMTLDQPCERVGLLRGALELWRGRAAENAADDWLRKRLFGELEEQRLSAIEQLAADEMDIGCVNVVPGLAQAVRDYPGHERLAELLMRALHQAGRKADALDAYDRTSAYLREELGLDPSPALRELQRAILSDELTNTSSSVRSPQLPVPQQLPAAVTGFTGRTDYLKELDAMLPAEGPPGESVVSVITGTVGVGKTALAVAWGRRVAGRFPDGQLYVNLRGFDPDGAPATPSEVLRWLLQALGVPAERIPDTLPARIGLYRSCVAGRRVLVVLDDARDADQVRPLLPGAPGCVAVVTSRNQLSGLVVRDGAVPVSLELPSAQEAYEMLSQRLGASNVAVEAAAAERIVDRYRRLPLALAITAARAAARPCFPLRALADEPGEPSALLDACSDASASVDVRTAFATSYRALSPDAATAFRLLSLHVGPDIPQNAAVSMLGTDTDVHRSLSDLVRAHLVREDDPGRYAVHGLLRAYSTELSDAVDGEPERRRARARLADHYLHSAHAAAAALHPHRYPIRLGPPRRGVTPEEFGGRDALAWFAREFEVLVALIELAASADTGVPAWQLAWTALDFVDRRERWHDWECAQAGALSAACRDADLLGQAVARSGMARVRVAQGRLDAAHSHLSSALDIFGRLADASREARAHTDIAAVLCRQRRFTESLQHLARALRSSRDAGDVGGKARALCTAGTVCAELGHGEAALEHARSALAIQKEIGDRVGEAASVRVVGRALGYRGEHLHAASCFIRGLELVREQGDRRREVDLLVELGETHVANGDGAESVRAWQAALEISREIDGAAADDISARLQGVRA
ncbi:AfsR/SARP family transcriptional regulator [Haloactinopolyspora alba]|nr:BTAD domain-containing putative transcriptional regulator [Haloactinopolyspora alba]